jgi:hypothetical protein
VRKARVADQTAGMTEQTSTPSSICLLDPQRRDEAVAQEGAQNSVKKGSTALHWAAYGDHDTVVQLLIEKGANVEAKGW